MRKGLIVLLLALLVAACGGKPPTPAGLPNPPAGPPPPPPNRPGGPPPTGQPGPPTPTAPPTAAAPAIPAADCTAGDPQQSQIYGHQIYLTTSPDGLTFDGDGALILDHASVPDLVLGPDGRLWVYFVNGEPGKHGIFAARQGEGGDWEVLGCVTLDGQFNGNAVDPNVTRLPDGRIQLVYFEGSFVGGPKPGPDAPHPIYRAVSEDGLRFTVQERLIAAPGVTDPSVVRLSDGSWLMALQRQGTTLLARSADGAAYELLETTFQDPGIGDLGVLPDGRVALYLSQIHVSADGGQTWETVPGRVPGDGMDASIVALPEGGYAFAYKRVADRGAQPGPPPPPGPPGGPPPTPADDGGMAMYTEARSSEVLPRGDYLAQVVTETPASSAWRYVTTLFGTLEAGQRYDVGGFCRIFPQVRGDGYDVTFGGAFDNRSVEEPRRYSGDVRRTLAADLGAWGEPQLFSEHPGDYAIDTDGRFYYLLNAHREGWVLGKYDGDFNLVKEVIVPLPAGHAANDQMLRVWDGRLYLSGIYNPNDPDPSSKEEADPAEALYTHVWVYDADLNPLGDHILDDEPNINGGTLLPYGDGFAYVTADDFLRNNLKALLYDANWAFVGSVPLEENGQWSMGGTVADGRIYIAYHRGGHEHGDVVLDVFDMDWNRLEQIPVTAVAEQFNAQRPWVLLDGDRLFVAYDLSGGGPGRLNLQCMINVYERR